MALMACAFSVGHADDKKAPAHQVPVESVEDIEAKPAPNPGAEDSAGKATEAADTATDARQQSTESKPDPDKEEKDTGTQAETGADSAATEKDAGESVSSPDAPPPPGQKPVTSGASTSDDAKSSETGVAEGDVSGKGVQPAPPRRKPPKPVIRKTERDKKNRKPEPALKRSDRDKYLCEALQACRNDFVRCKSKIKHPDQSREWSAAKEACGAVYKDCVHKDFDGGQWFFTRWFYFQELNCK